MTFKILTSFRLVPRENPFWNSVPCQRKSKKCKKYQQSKKVPQKYKFAERSHNFLYNYLCSLIFGDLSDLDKVQYCAKGKFVLDYRSVSKEIQKMQKIATPQNSSKKKFDRATLSRLYVYLISSTSMRKENPVANSGRPIKIRCAKYKFAERSHNFLMQLPMQLTFGDLWDLDKFRLVLKENPFWSTAKQ